MAKYQIKKTKIDPPVEIKHNGIVTKRNPKGPEEKPLSEMQVFLSQMLTNTIAEIKKSHNYINSLNHSKKLLKQLLNEAK